MALVRLNPLLTDRDYETVYYGSVPYTVNKNFQALDYDFLKHLVRENYFRKKDLKMDYYQFQFSSTEDANINDFTRELDRGMHPLECKEKKVVKEEPKKEVKEEHIEEEVKLEVKPLKKKKSYRRKRK